MDVQKIAVKLFLQPGDFHSVECVPVFHRWIQDASFADHMLIDVADYAHVDAGPGAVLVSDQANIHLDDDNHEPGLLYIRKRPLDGDLQSRLTQIIRYTLKAAIQLQSDPLLAGKIAFATDRLSIRFNDRRLAPNSTQTNNSLVGVYERLSNQLWPQIVPRVEVEKDPQRLAGADLRGDSNADLATLLSRLQ